MLFGNIMISDKKEDIKSGLLFYIEEGVVKSEAIVYLLEQEAALMEEINQAGMALITKEFIMELKERYNIKKQ